jgi:hypothetical protein
MDNAKKVLDIILGKFFGGYLGLRKNEQLKNKSVKISQFNKAYLNNLKKYYELVNEDSDGSDNSSNSED